jgi:hypothetical protein
MSDLLDTLAVVTRALEQARQALDAANAGATRGEDVEGKADAGPAAAFIPCTPKVLPRRLLVEAAKTAVDLNPVNRPNLHGPMAALGMTLGPQHIALLTSRYFGPQQRQLSVSFMEQTPADLRDRLLSHMNAWSARCGISFKWTAGSGEVRVSRGQGGYWSYLGTDVLHIPRGQPTMNLQGFTMSTPESEYRRVVRHETGHTLGFPHEHMRREIVERLDPGRTVAYFLRWQGWDAQTVQQQVLTPLEEAVITRPGLEPTAPDVVSIMTYSLPAEITRDGKPIPGGADIDESDYQFAARVYPKPGGGDDDSIDWLGL